MHILEQILPTIGYFGIFLIVFAESGLFFGFFLPGDSLLFTAGFLASQGIFDIRLLSAICFVAAVSGDSVGYWFGHKVGRRFFHKKDSLFFHQDNLKKTEQFYEKHGGKTIIIARFLPIIRTFAPIVAGIGQMRYQAFITYNTIGGLLWGVGLTLAGYFLGRIIPNVDVYILPIVAFIIIISLLPIIIHVLKDEKHRTSLLATINKFLQRKT